MKRGLLKLLQDAARGREGTTPIAPARTGPGMVRWRGQGGDSQQDAAVADQASLQESLQALLPKDDPWYSSLLLAKLVLHSLFLCWPLLKG